MQKIALALLIFLAISFKSEAFARGKSKISFEKKETTLYVDSLETKDSWTLYFCDKYGAVPYVDLADSLNILYGEGSYSIESGGENYIVRRNDNGATVQIDQEEKKIIFSDFDLFRQQVGSVTLLDIVFEKDWIRHEPLSYETRGFPIDIQYETFDIKIAVIGDQCLLPLQTFSDIFASSSIGTFLYNGKELFYVHDDSFLKNGDGSLTPLGQKYYETKPAALDKELAAFNLRELALNLQLNYGLKERHEIVKFSDWMEALGLFDRLSSTDSFESDYALAEICYRYLGDLHSVFCMSSPYTRRAEDDQEAVTLSASPSNIRMRQSLGQANNIRKDFFPSGIPGYQKVGDTAYVTFDSFFQNGRDYFEEPLTAEEKEKILSDYPSSGIDTFGLINFANQMIQSDKTIRNVVVDLSCNTGGSLDAEVFAACWLLGRSDLQIRQGITGCHSSTSYTADVNFDEKFGMEDDTVNDKRLFCLVSGITFSCANLMASTLSESGKATLIGSKSGGGSCAVYLTSSATGALFKTSSAWRFSYEKNGAFIDIDSGVAPDYKLTELNSFYNRSDKNGLTAFINKLY